MIKDIEKTLDSELIMLYHENDEDAKNIIYLKYKFIIDILCKKYQPIIKNLNVDDQELNSECLVGFSDALKNYQEDKDRTLPSFITFCIERRIQGLIRKYNREKHKILQNTYSLDYVSDDVNMSLLELLSDNSNEPLETITEKEDYDEFIEEIKEVLSLKEREIFPYLISGFSYQQIAKIINATPKQVDNTIQRIKAKIKKIMEEKKECHMC